MKSNWISANKFRMERNIDQKYQTKIKIKKKNTGILQLTTLICRLSGNTLSPQRTWCSERTAEHRP